PTSDSSRKANGGRATFTNAARGVSPSSTTSRSTGTIPPRAARARKSARASLIRWAPGYTGNAPLPGGARTATFSRDARGHRRPRPWRARLSWRPVRAGVEFERRARAGTARGPAPQRRGGRYFAPRLQGPGARLPFL